MRRTLLMALIALLAAGCDFGKRERDAAEAEHIANVEAAKQCDAKLKGLKRVPIAGTGGKLFLDAERLPNWAISRGFRQGDECGVVQLGWAYEIFYWTGKEITPAAAWLKAGHSLAERPGPQDWIPLGAMVFFGQSIDCKKNPDGCVKEPPVVDETGMIRLKNYPLDAWPIRDPKVQGQNLYSLSLREWPMENGRPRGLNCTGGVSGKSEAEIESHLVSISCELDFPQFKFKAGSARVGFSSKDFKRITPALQALQKYLNDSIFEGEQK